MSSYYGHFGKNRTPRAFLKEMKHVFLADTDDIPMFTVEPATASKMWKQATCPSTDTGANGEFYSAFKENQACNL